MSYLYKGLIVVLLGFLFAAVISLLISIATAWAFAWLLRIGWGYQFDFKQLVCLGILMWAARLFLVPIKVSK